ncbi:flippase-like domain-containing protein [Listeria booriae]|uniref:lysylphosphatidylglycerol synthase transmembrane domain-containing protein n=1 Tax=Listeria booriae TaxID=1552123 RepID=UPI00162886D0|nr:lysylphosphatidylglycerol synthase transmembrane domain-containing protein [Listeria booriae]MBC1551733.1 flippase-like domain-containing protein [Listeria booriae]MBC2056465.1 flippase-like domain-containing protein [Listeria booriae]MBC2325984.1 flippase-like domain-containing protein [Listeria booriae]
MGKNTSRHVLSILLVVAISVGFIFFQFRNVKWNVVFDVLKNVNLIYIGLACLAMFLYWWLEAVVLQRFGKQADPTLKMGTSFRITMIGQFFNSVTPFASGGQPAQLYLLTRRGIDIGLASSVLLIKFIIYQAMIVATFIFFLIVGFPLLGHTTFEIKYLILIGFVINLGVIIGLVTVAKSERVAAAIVHVLLKPVLLFVKKERREGIRENADSKIASFHEESVRFSGNTRLIWECVFYTTVQLLFYLSIPYFVLLSLEVTDVSLMTTMTYHAFVMKLSSSIPTPGGTGGAEYSFTSFFEMVLSPEKLVMALILWRLITYYSCTIFGAIAMIPFKRKKSKKRLGQNSR